MARRKTENGADPSAMTFEEALAGLESIVDAMEHQNLPLEELVANYEKGSLLLERCDSVLQSARKRIELITLRGQSAAGSPDSAAGTAQGFLPPSSAAADTPDDDDDIRLF